MDQTGWVQILEIRHEIYAVYREDKGNEFFDKIQFAALSKEGFLILLANDPHGAFDDATDCENFVRFHYGSLPDGANKG